MRGRDRAIAAALIAGIAIVAIAIVEHGSPPAPEVIRPAAPTTGATPPAAVSTGQRASRHAAPLPEPPVLLRTSPDNPLPPEGTPLRQIEDDLARRAAVGDAPAAARLFHDAYECRARHYLLEQAARAHPADPSTHAGLDESKQRVQRSAALCAGMDEEIDDGRIYDITLRAAELGDPDAACAYVNAPSLFAKDGRFGEAPSDVVDTTRPPPPDRRDEELIDEYRQKALDIANQGLLRGDWNMVEMLRGAFAANAVTAGPQLFEPDAALAYRYRLLWQLGDSDPSRRQTPVPVPEGLSEEQIADAQAWAQEMFAQFFTPRPAGSDDHRVCALPPLHGLD